MLNKGNTPRTPSPETVAMTH